MLDLNTIRQMSNEAAREAARRNKVPYIWENGDDIQSLRKIPNIGSYRPKGWTLVEEYFVDSSGFGQEGEPALTIHQMLKKMKVGMGYAIIEAGEFQVYIGEFRRERK